MTKLHNILALNIGSSTVKATCFELGASLVETKSFHEHVKGGSLQSLRPLADWCDTSPNYILHRVVHGGSLYHGITPITADMLVELETISSFAPLHMPPALSAIESAQSLWPDAHHFACFDTAFHHHMPAYHTTVALPRRLRDEGVRRYGFHGLSYGYIAHRMQDLLPTNQLSRVIVAHLGSGASVCALKDGKSVATSMGFSALDGLVMSTRTGALDAGIVLYLMQKHDMGANAIEQLLYKESGLLGLSGMSGDMRELVASSDPQAQLAVDIFCYRAAKEIAALLPDLGGLDALIFTAGIGEHMAEIRARICHHLTFLKVQLDNAANNNHASRISSDNSQIGAYVIPTHEAHYMAMELQTSLQ